MVELVAPHSSESFRTERLIATARVVLATVALIALRLDPSNPARFAELAFDLVTAFLVYSVGVALVAWLRPAAAARVRLPCHVADLVFFCAVIFVTQGPTSPFFVFFVFALVSAALRWQWRGTLATAVASLGAFLAIGAYAASVADDPAFELNQFIIRSAYLAVVAVLLGYLGDHERRLRRHAARVATMQERMRMARDLHDGVIQGLTGSALKLQAVRGAVGGDSARQTLDDVLHLLATEQRDLRRFMAEAALDPEADLREGLSRVRELPAKLERHWGMRVELRERLGEALDGAEVPPSLGRDVYRVVHEALINSARHGDARTARVELARDGDAVAISVADDGRGFPFHGELDLDELTRRRLGPVSLKQRIASLGGRLRLTSSAAGARLDIRLPLARSEEHP